MSRNRKHRHPPRIANTNSAATDFDPLREADYIIGRAQANEGRMVQLGALLFFSTETGDAWMLDVDDGFAIWLARCGERLPFRIEDTGPQWLIEWDRDFRIEDDEFVHVVKKTGSVTRVSGYPMHAIGRAVTQMRGG